MEEQYNFDINLDFFDSSATAPALTPQNATTTTAGDYKQGQPMYDIESLANRIASVDDVVVQLKTLKEDHVKLQKQMQDLSDSAMSIRCMYEREKTERAKYALLSKELQEKCDHAESQLTNKTLHFEQLTSKIEQSSVKGPIVYNELALKYQRLALQLEDDKQLNHKERASLQQIQEYIEAQKLTPLSAFKKKVQVAQPKKQFHDYAMQCDLRYETRTQGTSMEDTRLLKKEMCSQGTQYTWYTTTRGTNTPSINSPLKEVRTQGTQYISSTTTRGTCTSPLVKKQSIGIGTDFPEVMPFSIAHIFSEMLVQVPPISPIPDVPVAVRELETEKKKKVEMKSVSTNTGLQNVRKPIDYVQPSIKRSDSRPPSRNVYDRVKNELPFMAMPTMNPFSGLGMGPSPLHQTVAELWNMLGHTIFALVQNGSAPATPMQRNLSAHDIARRRERQRSRDEQSNPGKDYFEGEASDYLPNIRSTATSPISPQGYGVPDGTNFFGESYMQHPAAPPSAFVPVARSENKASSPIEIQKIMLNRGDQAEGMGISLKKTSRVDEILKLFPEHSQSSQKRKAIRSLLKTSKKEKKWSRNGIQTLELEPQTNLNDEQFVTSSGGLIYSNDSAMAGYGIAGSSKGESFSRPAQLSEEGFLGFQDEGCSVQSDEVFCKPFVPPKRRQTDVVTNPFDIRENERLQMGGGETTAIAHSSPGHERNENQRTNEMIGNCSPFLQNEGMESHRLQRAGGTNRGLEMPSIFNHFNEKDRKEDQQSQNGKEANNRLDVIHNTSLGKNINRKRRTSTPDARQYNKVYKIGESNNALVPVIHSNSAQRSLNLTKSAAQQDKKPPMNKRISPTLDRLQNSPFCDQKTLNLNKSNESSAPRKFKPSNSVLRQQKMLNLNRTATSGGKKSQKKSATGIKKQSNSFCPSQRSVSEIPLRKKDETDFDLNERQEKPRIQNLSESPTPNRCETDWDYNEVLETNSYDPSATRHENLSNPSIFSEIPGPNKVMSPYSVLQAQMASNFNKEQKKPLDAQVNSERPSLNEDDSKSVFRQKGLPDLGPSCSKFPSPTPSETDWDFDERQEKPMKLNLSENPSPNRYETDFDYNEVLETNSYDPSATRHVKLSNPSIFNEIPGPNKVMSLYSVLQAQKASNFNKEQKKPLDAQVNSQRPSLNEDDSESVFRQEGLPDLGPSCSKFPSPTPSETDWDFDERQEKPMRLNLSENPFPNRYETDFDYNEVLETNSYDPSATRQVKLSNPSIFNEIPGPNKELSPYFVLQAQNASNFNKEQKKPLDTQENSEHPSLKEDDSESIFRQEGLPNLGPSCIKFQYSTLNETDWGFDESQEKTPDISDDLIASELESPPKFNEFSALKEEKPLNSVFHTQKTSPGREEDCSAYPSNEQKTSNCYEFLETKQAKSINCGFEEQEMGSKVGNNVMFEAHDQRMSNSTPKQENQMYYLCQDQKTALENGDSQMFNDQRMSNSVAPEQVNSPKYVFQNEETTSDQRMLHSGEIPASNSVLQNQRAFNELFDSNGVIQDKKPALEQQPNYPLYGQRTINVNGFPGPKEEKPSNIVFQEKQSIESERTSPSERKPSSDQRLASEAGAFPKNEYPSTSGFTESASSDSEAELLIDCPHSSKLHYSSPPKTPEKKEGTLLQFQTPDGCNQNTSISKVLTRSTENLVDSKTRVEDAILVDKMLNEIRRSKSPISDIAPSENPLNSETENDEEVFKSQSNYKWKRKAPPTAAIAVKRSARLKAKESASTLSFSNIPGVQLGKYTKKRTERKRELKKPNEAEEVKEEKVEKKVEIISEIQLGFFKDLMEEEKLVIDDVPEPISPLKEVLFKKTAEDFDTFQRQSQAIQKGTPSEGISSTQVEPKSESIFKLPLEEVGSYRPTSWEETSSIQSDNTTPFEDQKSNEFCQRIPWRNRIETNLSDDKPNVIQEDHSSELISCKEKPASPPPIEQRPNETHITREIVESLPETTKPTHNSMISHLIANYNPTHQKILAQACQMDKDLLAQLQSIINGFTNGLGLVMDCIRMVDTLLDLTTSETHIAQAFIVIVKAAPRPETENAPIRELCLSQTLRKLISLFQPLHSRLPGLRRHLQSAIEQSLFTFTNDTMPLEVAMNLTQFYLAVIADTTATNNPARLFICKCLYFYNQKAIPMIYETLCVYPSVLPKRDDSTYDRSDALINTIQCLLMSTYYDMEKTDLKTREIFTKLRKFYNYESFKPPRDEVIENLIAKIQAGRFKNVSYAFVLICKRMDQKTTEKLVLAERLLPLANEYYHTLTQTTEYDERIACVLECISFIIKPFHLGTDISMYINLFGRFLNASNRQTIQEAALTALLRTVRFGYVHCFNAIYDFKPNYELANETKAMLKSFIYKKGLEFLRKLEHQARMLVTT